MSKDEISASPPTGRGPAEAAEDNSDSSKDAHQRGGEDAAPHRDAPRATARRRFSGRQTSLDVPKPAYVVYEEKLARQNARAKASGEQPHEDSEGISFLPETPSKTPRATIIRRWIYLIVIVVLYYGLRYVERQH